MTRRLLLAIAIAAFSARPALAQQADPAPAPTVHAWVADRFRVESWRFFEPPSPAIDPDYTFLGNRADLGIRVQGPRFGVSGGFAYVGVERLPRNAIGPGGLGTGAFYFAASGLPYSYQVFLTELTASVSTGDGRVTVVAGRMPYTSGAEGTDGARGSDRGGLSPSARLDAVRRLRLDGRTLGTFDWSHYQRRYDGVRVHYAGRDRYAGGGLFLPTEGGYEESANLTMPKLLVGTAYAGWRHGATGETQAFVQSYRDRRAVDIRPDNARVPVTEADVTLFGAGASHVASRPFAGGEADVVAWGAVQGGDWYGEQHRALAVALEGGYRRPRSRWKPWARAGISYASGDDAPDDDRHATYFPLLQDTRTYALSMVYAPMNLRDAFVQLLAEPHARSRVRVDLHRLDLAQAADRWYQGSGATAGDGQFFGYSARQSSQARALGTVLEATTEVRLSPYWSINGYVGRMWGGPVVRGVFRRDRLTFWYVENVLRLDWRVAGENGKGS